MIKMIVSDLDGTLLNKEKQISLKDRQAIEEASRQGIQLCLASGRMHAELTQVMEELQIPVHRISQNGAFTYTREEKRLDANAFLPDLAHKLYQIAAPYRFVTFVCVEQTIYIPERTEASDLIEQRMFERFVEEPQIGERIGEEMTPCKFSFFGEMERLLQMKAEVEHHFGGQMDAVISDKDCVDLMPLGVSKGKGLQELMIELGLTGEEVICIGDAFNDVSMFDYTPHSFVMRHSLEGVKKLATHVVDHVSDAIDWVLRYNQEQATETTDDLRPEDSASLRK